MITRHVNTPEDKSRVSGLDGEIYFTAGAALTQMLTGSRPSAGRRPPLCAHGGESHCTIRSTVSQERVECEHGRGCAGGQTHAGIIAQGRIVRGPKTKCNDCILVINELLKKPEPPNDIKKMCAGVILDSQNTAEMLP